MTDALKDLKDHVAFHRNISVAMGTALQHLADSLFVHLTNLIFIHQDSYLDHVKAGIKQDTWNQLCNGPPCGYGLFPDSVICTAEQDITKQEATGVAPGPSLGASEHNGWRSNYQYKPYHSKEAKLTGQGNNNSHLVVSLPGAG